MGPFFEIDKTRDISRTLAASVVGKAVPVPAIFIL
jgi:hypothetical protein